MISVDCKKKELLGNFKNNGREWQAAGEDTVVNVYDFLSLASGKAVPYGIYDLVHTQGCVNVGIDHDTAAFAVESIRCWWQQAGKALYPGKKHVLITADGGGSNGARNRLWKKMLQELANSEQLSITVAHYPPATSKWNKIEHKAHKLLKRGSFTSVEGVATPRSSLLSTMTIGRKCLHGGNRPSGDPYNFCHQLIGEQQRLYGINHLRIKLAPRAALQFCQGQGL
jgi:hypothetical protein